MMRPSQRRTRGIITNMVGNATTQAISHEDIQVSIIAIDKPRARQVATPETRNVIKNVVPIGRAKRMQLAGNFFTAARTLCYGRDMSKSLALPFRTAKQLAS